MTDTDLTRRSPEDGILRSFEEYYDTQSDVEQDPYGAWDAIQKLSAALEVERAETARRKWEDWRQIATLASDRAEALDAKLKEAVDVMQAWKTAGPDQVYYQAVQKRNAFLASLEGDKP